MTINEPKSLLEHDSGYHNNHLENARERLYRGGTYRDLSTIIICPSRGSIPCRVVSSWMALIRPMNQKVFGPLFATGYEVGNAYTELINVIINNKELTTWQYVLSIEEDNVPPPDGLLKLYESIESKENGGPFDAVGGIYWTKGECGQPMCYGNPAIMPKNFIPFLPPPDTIQPCNGLGMGFTLFRLSSLKMAGLPSPLFKTVQEYKPGVGVQAYTQDLAYFEASGKLGQRFACDTRVKVGHYDSNTQIIW